MFFPSLVESDRETQNKKIHSDLCVSAVTKNCPLLKKKPIQTGGSFFLWPIVLDKYPPTIDNADIVSTASIISGSDMP
jgi:hypothetical protein